MTFKKLLFRSIGRSLNALSYVSPKQAGKLAFRLFATPPKPNLRPKEQVFLDTADRMDITWNGLKIPVYAWGPPAGPVVFCAYGWGYNAGRWRHYAPTLVGAGYRFVAFDPPGHGQADSGNLIYPDYVDIETKILRKVGGCHLVLSHSFGGGCLVEALRGLPEALRPERAVFMGIFSEVRWIFVIYATSLRLRPVVFQWMVDHIRERTGRPLAEFDVAINGTYLPGVERLLVHDPADQVTDFRNARRNHSHWPGSYLYTPEGAGHHLGTAEVTRNVLAFLTDGTLPPGTITNNGDLDPLPPLSSSGDPVSAGGISTYYT